MTFDATMSSIRFGGSGSSIIFTPVQAKGYSSNIWNTQAYKQIVCGTELKEISLKTLKHVCGSISISQGRSLLSGVC